MNIATKERIRSMAYYLMLGAVCGACGAIGYMLGRAYLCMSC